MDDKKEYRQLRRITGEDILANSKKNNSRNIRKNKRKKRKDIEITTHKKRVKKKRRVVEEVKHKKKKKKKNIILNRLSIIVKLLLIILVIVFTYILSVFLNVSDKGYYTVAIFGVDSRDGNTKDSALSDVNIIASINMDTGDVRLASIYRDTYSLISKNGEYHKLNEAYFKGGAAQAMYALEKNLDMHIDDYVTFNWKSVADAINILGGVDIEITKPEYEYINSFITMTVKATGVGSHQLKSYGMQHLDGIQAVAYSRLRLMDTDFNRTQRQRKVIELAIAKAKSSHIGTINNLLVNIYPQIETSINFPKAIKLARNVRKYKIVDTCGYPFEKITAKFKNRAYVIPTNMNEDVTKLHQFLYPNKEYNQSDEFKNICKKIYNDTKDIIEKEKDRN